MKASLKAPIVYNRDENSYVYEEHGLFCFIYDTKQKGEIQDNETREL
ncbi:hypothetical protein [Pedobacter sp. HMWF019]|nr:hypothetical protein [Pedobacter sp. HMWF019]